MFPYLSPAFQRFIAPAQERAEFWRTTLGFIFVVTIFLIAAVVLALGTTIIGEIFTPGLGESLMYEIQSGQTIFATLSSLGLIALMIPALWLVLRLLHKRSLRTLLGPSGKIIWRLWLGAAAVILVLAVVDAIATFASAELTQQMSFLKWTAWLAPSLVLLFLQTTAEEMVFRGYLLQQLAARFKSRWIWWVLPSVIFGAFHWNPVTFGANAWMVVGTTTLMGLILSDITARFGSLSPAMGLHFANNLVVMLLMNSPGQLSGMSLYLYGIDLKSPQLATSMLVSLVAMTFGYAIFMLIMRRRRL